MKTKDKVKFYKTPDSILQRELEIFDKVEAEYSLARTRCSRRSPHRRGNSRSGR